MVKGESLKVPRHEIDALARCFLPAIQMFFESEEGIKEFEEWKISKENMVNKKYRLSKAG